MIASTIIMSSALTIADVERVAALAHLELTADEMALFTRQLDGILQYAQQLQAIDTAGVAPMAHPLDRPQRFRPDAVTEVDRHELYQRNAPLVERDLYLVPKVIE